ncbi:hypothetical protein [Actinokineospora inagensis]|uniref:hypothetical protein n=1 Tax=Actinokineospora inagensis TaxID=103730 RepID=UPI00040EFB90|nr:hypothetical protein [Actinokineospora inagensis]
MNARSKKRAAPGQRRPKATEGTEPAGTTKDTTQTKSAGHADGTGSAEPPVPAPPSRSWWKRTATKLTAVVGSLALAVVTGVVTAVATKAGDEVSQPLLREGLGDPVAALGSDWSP